MYTSKINLSNCYGFIFIITTYNTVALLLFVTYTFCIKSHRCRAYFLLILKSLTFPVACVVSCMSGSLRLPYRPRLATTELRVSLFLYLTHCQFLGNSFHTFWRLWKGHRDEPKKLMLCYFPPNEPHVCFCLECSSCSLINGTSVPEY